VAERTAADAVAAAAAATRDAVCAGDVAGTATGVCDDEGADVVAVAAGRAIVSLLSGTS
jgi:hypothetical protein